MQTDVVWPCGRLMHDCIHSQAHVDSMSMQGHSGSAKAKQNQRWIISTSNKHYTDRLATAMVGRPFFSVCLRDLDFEDVCIAWSACQFSLAADDLWIPSYLRDWNYAAEGTCCHGLPLNATLERLRRNTVFDCPVFLPTTWRKYLT